MKGLFIAILALAAAPVFAQVKVTDIDLDNIEKVTEDNFSGSLASRAVAEAKDAALEARQSIQGCRLPPSVFVGDPGAARPANLDGACISFASCQSVGGEAFTGATGCNFGDCCVKRDCAGPNSNSACLFPNLAGDTLQPGQAGRFVNGLCPSGLACFQLTRF